MSEAMTRFRPVVLRGDDGTAEVYYLYSDSDGLAVLREFDWPVPLAVPLEDVTVDHLPPSYQQAGLTITVGPTEELRAPTAYELHHRLRARLAELRTQPGHDLDISARRT